MAGSNKIGEAYVEVKAVDLTQPGIDAAKNRVDAMGRSYDPTNAEDARRALQELRTNATKEDQQATLQAFTAQQQLTGEKLKTAQATGTYAQQLKTAKSEAFGLSGQLAAITGTAAGFLRLGVAISEGVAAALKTGKDRAVEFQDSLDFTKKGESVDKIRERLSALNSALATYAEASEQTGEAVQKSMLGPVGMFKALSDTEVDEAIKIRFTLGTKEEIEAERKRLNNQLKDLTGFDDAERKRKADADKKAAEDKKQAEIAARRESLAQQLQDSQAALLDEEGKARFAAEREEAKLLEMRDNYRKINANQEAATIEEIVANNRSALEKQLRDIRTRKEEENRAEIERQRQLALAIQNAVRDALVQSANSANAQAGFTSEVVSSLQGLTQEVKRIQSNVRTVSQYAGPGGNT